MKYAGLIIAILGTWLYIAYGTGLTRKALEENIQVGLDNQYTWADTDDGMWVAYAQTTLEEGVPPTKTKNDNFGKGRPIGWSPTLMRLGAGLGWVWAKVTGEKPRRAVEKSAVFWNPLLLILGATTIILLLWKLGGNTALVFYLTWIASLRIQGEFAANHPDHQGILLLGSLGLIAGALAGQRENGRKWAILGGISGGIAIGVSAATGILGWGIAALATIVALTKQGDKYAGNAWRTLGWAGSCTALIMWGMDRAPNILFAFETNGPLHALAILGGAHILALLSDWRAGVPPKKGDIILACSILPMILTIGIMREDFITSQDQFLKQLMWGISELQPVTDPVWFVYAAGIGAMATLVWSNKKEASGERERIWVLTAGITAMAIGITGNRFEPLGISVMTLIAGGYLAATNLTSARTIMAVALITGSLGAAQSLRQLGDIASGKLENRGEATGKTAAELALAIKKEKGTLIIDANLGRTSRTYYYLKDTKMGPTIYWESLEGMKTLAAILANANHTQAMDMLYNSGASHLVTTPEEIGNLVIAAHGRKAYLTGGQQRFEGYSGADWATKPPNWMEKTDIDGLWRINRQKLKEAINQTIEIGEKKENDNGKTTPKGINKP